MAIGGNSGTPAVRVAVLAYPVASIESVFLLVGLVACLLGVTRAVVQQL